jgi:hypothetical protein
VSKILYFRIYMIVHHLCFCDFQSINGLDSRVGIQKLRCAELTMFAFLQFG